MKLLVITRKIDRDDPQAGFAYGWVKKIAENLRAENGELSVICLEKGDITALPENLEIFSLGKEKGAGRLLRYFNFIKLALKLVPKCDGIFCHMNPEYTIAIAPFAKIFHKRIVSWYTHTKINPKMKKMTALANAVFSATEKTFPLKSAKVILTGNSIDVDFFKPTLNPGSVEDSGRNLIFKILNIGKVLPNKNYETLIDAADILINKQKNENLKFIIINGASAENNNYVGNIKNIIDERKLKNNFEIIDKISNFETIKYYQDADLFVNLSTAESINKTILEAMACGAIVLTSNQSFKQILSNDLIFNVNDPADLAAKITAVKNMTVEKRRETTDKLREEIIKNHNLENVVKKIISWFKNK